MKEGAHKKKLKEEEQRKFQTGPPYLSLKKHQVDSKRKDMEWSTMFSENIINLTYCTIVKIQASREDKFSA